MAHTITNTKIPGYTIRSTDANDTTLLLDFIHQIAEYEKLKHEVIATEASLRESLFGRNPIATAVIGEYEGSPVSYAIYFQNFSTFIGRSGFYLEDLYVKPEHRGRGFGKVLLSYVARVAVEAGARRFEWSVLNWNTPAIEFYKSLGAFPMSEWTVYRITDDKLRALANADRSNS